MAVADNHGDMIDPRCEEAVLDFLNDFKPEVRVHLGDAWDQRCLRRGASEEDRNESLEYDIECGSNFLCRFFKGGKENYFLNGNHDMIRLERLLRSTNALIRRAAEDGLDHIKATLARCRLKQVLPYDSRLGVLRLGHLKCIHGYSVGVGAGARHARAYGNVIYGHTHTIETHTVDSCDEPKEARGIGALCLLDMDYNSTQINKLRHSNGWAYGYLFDDGSYHIMQARRIGNTFYAAHEITQY